MVKVVLDMSMSLDGFIAGANVGKEYPMGVNGENLHTWIFSTPKDKVDADVEREMFAKTGAVILGNRTFEVGVDLWGDVPFPVPSFVLTHKKRETLIKKSGTFTFVTDGIESALWNVPVFVSRSGRQMTARQIPRQHQHGMRRQHFQLGCRG